MMSDSAENKAIPAPLPRELRRGRGILCQRCEHINPESLIDCEYCADPLRIECPSCKETNPRILTQCQKCKAILQPTLVGSLLSKIQGRPDRKSRPSTKVIQAGKAILCANCEHLNSTGLENCERCKASLFTKCPTCSTRNSRVFEKCSACQGPLQRSLLDRVIQSKPSARFSQSRQTSGTGTVDSLEETANQTMGPGIACAKCSHVNPLDLQRCTQCRGHLFVTCHECGEVNARNQSRCNRCERRLHKNSKAKEKVLDTKPVNLLYFGIAIASLLLGGFILIRVIGLRLLN